MSVFPKYSVAERKALDLAACGAFLLTLELGLMNLSQPFVHLVQSDQVLHIVHVVLSPVITFGALYLFFRMFFHCATNRNIPLLAKIVLLAVFLFLAWVAALFYYILLYRGNAEKIRLGQAAQV